jgi:cytoskeletal protein CcmA (bactofilin family)
MTKAHRLAASLLGLLVLAGCQGTQHVNGAVNIAPSEVTGDVSTVNGSVQIGAKAQVAAARSVNGDLSLGQEARARSLSTVNGAIEIAAQASVSGNVQTVNGALRLAPGARVGVNGAITVDGAHVVGRLRTVNGPISVLDGARIDGGILLERPHDFFSSSSSRPPRVVIGRDVSIGGTLKFEREVRLYVCDQVKHLGPIEGATPISYSGDTPPE